ncbi:MAG TPA: ABC transporter permease [Vicinamibacterales bacterium]|nr:ABC transporter permease [Vicinamibacterales bacterium]
MKRLALFLIGIATPSIDREAVVGDTIERFDELCATEGERAAQDWLWREARRVLATSPQHRLAARPAWHQAEVQRRSGVTSSILQDVRYALRWFRRSPGFTAVAVLTLALGIGANTAIFAVVNAVLLKPLPFASADRLMLVHLLMPMREGGLNETIWSFPKYRTLIEGQQVFEDTALFAGRPYSLSGDGDPEVVQGEVITETYPSVLGVRPILGRLFTSDEASRAGATPVAIISHSLWVRRYGSDSAVLNRTLQVDGVTYSVIGVLPRGFTGLSGNAEIWTPLGVTDASSLSGPHDHSYSMAARRRPDASEAAVVSALQVYGTRVDDAYREGPRTAASSSATARSVYDSRVDADLRRAVLIILGAVGFVLLIACVNLTNLLVVKSVARSREVAIRVSLGAGRARVARQFLIESVLLAGAGGIAGVAVASLLLAGAGTLLPDSRVFFETPIAPGAPRIEGAAGLTRVGAGMIGLDLITLAFTAGVAILTTILVSVLPAFQASAVQPLPTLKVAGGQSTARGFGRFGSRAILVGAEISLALVLLAGAGLMLKSASRLEHTSIGVDPENVLSAQLNLPSTRYDRKTGPLFQQNLLERVRAVPGVESAGWGFCMPVSGGCNGTTIWFPPQAQAARRQIVGIAWATAGYFDALRIPVVEGRNFTDTDRIGQPKVAVVNQTAARTYWPGESAIGKRIAVGQGGFQDGAEVVGVVADVRYRTLETAPGPDVFLPLGQSYRGYMQLVVRTHGVTRGLSAAITREVRGLDPNLPIIAVKTMEERIGDAMWRTRVAAWLLSAFAGLALLLTAVGIFGVMAQLVSQRTSEIGIRMALGASRGDVMRLVLGRATLVTAIGLTVGLIAALGLTRVLATLLYQITPTDPVTLVAVAGVLGSVSLLACYVPARRALKVDAVTALRSE